MIYRHDESLFLLTAVNLPTNIEVLDASPNTPYMSIVLRPELIAATQLITEFGLDDSLNPPGQPWPSVRPRGRCSMP
jgi:hypothetical protein